MPTSIPWRGGLFLAVLLAARPLVAQTNDMAAATARCLARMDALLIRLTEMEQAASNEVARARCIADARANISSLRDLAGTAAGRLPSLIADDATEAIAAEQSAITIACGRADKLAAEAEACESDVPIKPKKARRPVEPPAASIGRLAELSPRRPVAPPRDPENCVKQMQLAQLLMRAIGLTPDPHHPSRTPADELSRYAIEPTHGWKPEACVDLDDLCTVVARALNLKVETPNDPVSNCDALRAEGLPVDACFPRRTEGADPPLLLESEVREFFAKGYAAPLPSSQRRRPE